MLAVEAGAISGFLAGRVLGQYEFPVLDPDAPARLLFVAPNLGHAATQLDADADQLLRWVALHEIDARAAVRRRAVAARRTWPGMVRELLGALDVDPGALLAAARPSTTSRSCVDTRARGRPRRRSSLGPERRALLDRVQAFMAVLEGYAEHVMDAVGADVLDDLPRCAPRSSAAARDRSGLLRLLERLIGMDLKLRQYEQGKRFCDARRRARRHRRRSTASGRAPRRCRRSPSSTTRPAGSAHRAPRAALAPSAARATGARTRTKSARPFRLCAVGTRASV